MPNLNSGIRAQLERQLEQPAPASLQEVAAAGQIKSGRIKVSDVSRRTSADGKVFASKWELSVYEWLRRIIPDQHLHLQPSFFLQPEQTDDAGRKVRAVRYFADFLISDKPRTDESAPLGDCDIVIDAKGWRTEIFRIKAKLFVGVYGRYIRLVRQGHEEDLERISQEYQKRFEA